MESATLDYINRDLTEIKARLVDIDKKIDGLDAKYVTQAEFKPVRYLVYGFAGLALTSVFGALIGMVVLGK